MADKSFGLKQVNLIGASGTPRIESPNNLNINATNVAISTDISVGGTVTIGTGATISSPATNVLALGTNNTEVVRVSAGGTFSINGNNYPSSGALSSRNIIINGDFRINQRGGSNTTINTYALDRWRSYGGPMGFTISQQDVLSSLGTSRFALRFQRTSGNTQANNTGVAQGIESKNCEGLAGTQLTLSFKARKGANLSDDLDARFFFGTGTDDNPVGMTGQTSNTTTYNLTTSFVKYTKTVTVPAGTTQISIGFDYTPTGTAGANDWFEIAEVQIERGSVATPFEHRSFSDELARCQRYFEKTFATDTAPAQNAGRGGALETLAIRPANTTGLSSYFRFTVPKRITPSMTYFNPSAANAQARNLDTNTDCSNTNTDNMNSIGGKVFYTLPSSTVSTNLISVHWTADAEL